MLDHTRVGSGRPYYCGNRIGSVGVIYHCSQKKLYTLFSEYKSGCESGISSRGSGGCLYSTVLIIDAFLFICTIGIVLYLRSNNRPSRRDSLDDCARSCTVHFN